MECLVCLLSDESGYEAVSQQVQAGDAHEAVQLVMQAYGLTHVDVAVVLAHGRLCLTRCNVWCALWSAPLGD